MVIWIVLLNRFPSPFAGDLLSALILACLDSNDNAVTAIEIALSSTKVFHKSWDRGSINMYI